MAVTTMYDSGLTYAAACARLAEASRRYRAAGCPRAGTLAGDAFQCAEQPYVGLDRTAYRIVSAITDTHARQLRRQIVGRR